MKRDPATKRQGDLLEAVVTAAGFAELEHYYRPPGLPRSQQPWLATVWREAPPTWRDA